MKIIPNIDPNREKFVSLVSSLDIRDSGYAARVATLETERQERAKLIGYISLVIEDLAFVGLTNYQREKIQEYLNQAVTRYVVDNH